MPPRKKVAPKSQCKLSCCAVSDVVKARIAADAERWEPGLWATENSYSAACICGLNTRGKWLAAGGGTPTGECARHPETA